MEELLDSILDRIKQDSTSDLRSRKSVENLSEFVDGRIHRIAIWKDELEDGSVRVVVQCYRPLFLGLGRMYAKGFLLSESGAVRELAQAELHEFS